jgi:hypothetical protein
VIPLNVTSRPAPIICRYLRTKKSFGTLAGALAPWQEGRSTTAAYWCLATMDAAGPDNSFAHPHHCCDGRSCFAQPAEE